MWYFGFVITSQLARQTLKPISKELSEVKEPRSRRGLPASGLIADQFGKISHKAVNEAGSGAAGDTDSF